MRPEGITDEHLRFLDKLRESGATNMWGAAPYVQQRFGIESQEAQRILGYWMNSFGDENR